MEKTINTAEVPRQEGPDKPGLMDFGYTQSKRTQLATAGSMNSTPNSLNSAINPELMNNPLFDKNSIVDEMSSEAVQNQLASNQSTIGLIRRGVGNFANTALFETLKVGGVVAGLLKNGYGMIDPNAQAKTSDIWDNSIYRYLDEVQQSNANSDFLKVYKSASYEDASAFGKLATGEWWADTFASGLGFMASMFVPGQALKSMSLGGKVLSLVEGTGGLLNKAAKGIGVIDVSSDLMRIGKMANTVGDTLEATRKALTAETQFLNTSIKEALAKGEDIVKYTDQLKKVNSEIAAVSKTLAETKGIFQSGFSTKWINGADNLTSSFVSGVIEASAEGHSSQHETFNNLMKSGKYTREQALEMASNKAANVFKQNIGLLMVSNLIDEALVFKWFNKSSNPESTVRRVWNSTVGLDDIVPPTLYGKVKKGANKVVNNKIARNLAEFGFTSIKEAWEESAQKNISDNASTNSASIVDGNLANIIDGGWAGITALPDMVGKNADDAIAGAVLGGLMGGYGQRKKARVEDEMIKGIGARNKKLFGLIKARVGREGLTSTYANIYNGINFSKKFSDLEKEGKVVDGKISKEEMDKLSEDDSRRVEMALAYNTALKKGDKVAISQIEDVIITNVLMKALPQHSADTNMIDLVADELIKTFEEQHKNTNVATSVRRVAEAIKKTKESVDRVSGPIVDEFDRLLYQDRFRNTLAQIVETNKYVAVRDILSQYNLPEDYIDNYESYTAGNSSTPTYTSREEADKVKGNDYYTKVGVEETKDGNFINIFERKGIKYIQNEKGSYVKYNNIENKEEYEKSYEELKKDDRYPSLLKQNIEDQAQQEDMIKSLGLYDIDGHRIYKGESLQSYHKKEADRFQSKLIELYDKNKIAERREQWKKGVEERTAEQTFIDSIKPGEVYVHPLQNGYITKGEDGNFYYKNVNTNQEVLPEIIPRNGFVLDADGKAKKELDALIAHGERLLAIQEAHEAFVQTYDNLQALEGDSRKTINALIQEGKQIANEYMAWLEEEIDLMYNSSIYKNDYVNFFEQKQELEQRLANVKSKINRINFNDSVSRKLKKKKGRIKRRLTVEKLISDQDKVIDRKKKRNDKRKLQKESLRVRYSRRKTSEELAYSIEVIDDKKFLKDYIGETIVHRGKVYELKADAVKFWLENDFEILELPYINDNPTFKDYGLIESDDMYNVNKVYNISFKTTSIVLIDGKEYKVQKNEVGNIISFSSGKQKYYNNRLILLLEKELNKLNYNELNKLQINDEIEAYKKTKDFNDKHDKLWEHYDFDVEVAIERLYNNKPLNETDCYKVQLWLKTALSKLEKNETNKKLINNLNIIKNLLYENDIFRKTNNSVKIVTAIVPDTKVEEGVKESLLEDLIDEQLNVQEESLEDMINREYFERMSVIRKNKANSLSEIDADIILTKEQKKNKQKAIFESFEKDMEANKKRLRDEMSIVNEYLNTEETIIKSEVLNAVKLEDEINIESKPVDNLLDIIAAFEITEKGDDGKGVHQIVEEEPVVREDGEREAESKTSIVQKTIAVDVEFKGKDVTTQAEGVIIDGKQAYVGKLDDKPYNITRRNYIANNNIEGRKGRIFAYNELPEEAKQHMLEGNATINPKETDLYILIVDRDNPKDFQKHNGKYVITTIPTSLLTKIAPKIKEVLRYLRTKRDGVLSETTDKRTIFTRTKQDGSKSVYEISSTVGGEEILSPLVIGLLEEYYQETLALLNSNKITDIEFTKQSNGFSYTYKDVDGKYLDRPLSDIFNLEDIDKFSYITDKKGSRGRNVVKLKNGSELEVRSSKITNQDALNIIKVISGTKDKMYDEKPAIYNMVKAGKVTPAILSQYYPFGVRLGTDGKTDTTKQQMFVNGDKLIIFAQVEEGGITRVKKFVFDVAKMNETDTKIELIKVLTSITKRIDAISQDNIYSVFEANKLVEKTGKQLMLETFTSAIVSKELPVVGIYNQYNILGKHIVEKPVEVEETVPETTNPVSQILTIDQVSDIGYFGTGTEGGYYDGNKNMENTYGSSDMDMYEFNSLPKHKGYAIKTRRKGNKKIVSLHFLTWDIKSDRGGGHTAVLFEIPTNVEITKATLDKFIPIVDKFKNDNYSIQSGKLRPKYLLKNTITPDIFLFATPTITIGSPIDTTLPSDPRKIKPIAYVNAPATLIINDDFEEVVDTLFLKPDTNPYSFSELMVIYSNELQTNDLRSVLLTKALQRSGDTTNTINSLVNEKFDKLLDTMGNYAKSIFEQNKNDEELVSNIGNKVREILNILSTRDQVLYNTQLKGTLLYDDKIALNTTIQVNTEEPVRVARKRGSGIDLTSMEANAKVELNNPLDMLVNNNVIEKTDC